MEKWQIEKSEIAEILFRVFSCPSFRFYLLAKIEKSDLNMSEKNSKIADIFRVFDLAQFK